jgi:hypothetical protein
VRGPGRIERGQIGFEGPIAIGEDLDVPGSRGSIAACAGIGISNLVAWF